MCFIKIGNADTFNNNLVIDNIARVYIIVICDDIIVCQNTPDLFYWLLTAANWCHKVNQYLRFQN